MHMAFTVQPQDQTLFTDTLVSDALRHGRNPVNLCAVTLMLLKGLKEKRKWSFSYVVLNKALSRRMIRFFC